MIRSKQSSKYLRLVEDDLEKIQEYDHTGEDMLFYEEIQEKVREIARTLISVLDYEMLRTDEDSRSLTPSIEGLKSILKYLNILRLMCKHFENYAHFMMVSSISVLTDYNKSTVTVQDYANLKTVLA